MPFNPFSALTSKIFGAVSLALLIVLGITYIDARHWRKVADQRAATIAQFAVAQKQAEAAARRALADQEARYKEHAHEADTQHTDELARAQSDADRYLASHRVPACPGSASRPAVATSSGSGASVPASVPSGAVVADADVQACTGAATYALDAREGALGLPTNSTPAP